MPIYNPSQTLAKSPKKADVVDHLEAFHHVGLLFNEPPDRAGLFFN